ncbi:lipase family protein [Aldersonia kunmingensis]|uniref:lipase family protein n=1 Tax=Aldersonia kunmingensis TaxID=408066 RepID=UPI00082B9354|nr:lipase family protein [Aldersonia kunmingensis]
MSRLRRVAAIALLGVVGGATLGVTPAAAAPVGPFYTPPAQYSTEQGAVIKTESVGVLAAVPVRTGWPVPAQKVMYTSRLQDGTPTAVTGTFIDSSAPWNGPGPRPTVVIAPGTQGQGDQCAISVALPTGMIVDPGGLSLSANQELPGAALWNLMGARVFITDHIGLGTPGVHTYVNRAEGAHAVLDAARAANRLSNTGPETPLLFWGYSQGGGATAAAAELQPTYAPELNLKGTWAGAPTADIGAVLRKVDGALIGGAIGFAINGLVARYPELQGSVDRIASPEGQALLATLGNECIGDVIFKHPFMKTTSLTADHRPLFEHLASDPAAMRAIADQRIGRLTPTSPVLITSGINDDTVPYPQARQLAVDWCDKGAPVTFRTNHFPPLAPGTTIPGHFGPEIVDAYVANNVVPYLMDRLGDKPIGGCSIA